MKYSILLSALLLAACNSAQTVQTAEPPVAAAPAEATTQQQATDIATRYFRSLPDSAVYLLPTMRVMDAGSRWQVLVKRSDRAGIKPDVSAIEIDKGNGSISTVPVK